MDQRLVAADNLLKAGRVAEAADLITQVLTDAPDNPANVYRILVHQLYQQKRYDEGAVWAQAATERFPKDFALWNMRGVILRRLSRYPEALKALDQAQKLDPKSPTPLVNRGNIYNDMGAGPAAEAIFVKLARQEPRNAEHHRSLGRALLAQKKYEAAISRSRQAVTLKKDFVDAWLDWSAAEAQRENVTGALEVIERAIASAPGNGRLLEAKATILRRMGQMTAAEEFLMSLLPLHGNEAWLHYALGGSIADRDHQRANAFYRRAVDLDPGKLDYRLALVESLERSRYGDEGANIEAAYQLYKESVKPSDLPLEPRNAKVANELLIRVCAFDELERLGSFRDLGRGWAEDGRHAALLKQLARVRTTEDRYELVEQHRIWGDRTIAAAARNPIRPPKKTRSSDKIRVGFMSSDLRRHPVGYFAYPLFENIDRDRFDVFVYSFYQGGEDVVQAYIASKVTGFRWNPDISVHDAAQMIADDDLDMLVELGGSTHMNKLEVMAYKPARLHASWLGYPHSAGLRTIDYLLVDPYLMPQSRDLILERPLELPHTWYPLDPHAFRDDPPVDPAPAFQRKGFVTFGTANNPQKYTLEVLDAWARVVAAVPQSRFLFVRPESGTAQFRRNIEAAFAKRGVAADRLDFHPVRGQHLPVYNEMDISLDPFPQTGGTTTCESLWMGVPVVTLVGPSVFERLSYSALMNAGLEALTADTVDKYVQIAIDLAGDTARLAELKQGLRERMKASPMGDTRQFAIDFYETVAGAVTADLSS